MVARSLMRALWTRDEIILATDLIRMNEWRGLDENRQDVRALSELLRAHPFHVEAARQNTKYRNPAGVARKTWDIASSHPDYRGTPTKGNRIDALVLNDFLADPTGMARLASTIREHLTSGVELHNLHSEDLGDFEAPEGRMVTVMHLRRERDPKLRRKKLEGVLASGGTITCEVCCFNFGKTYGERGQDYIEVHHVLPLSISGETLTRLTDLALLCSNCHRVLHRTRPWMTPVELKKVVHSNRNTQVFL